MNTADLIPQLTRSFDNCVLNDGIARCEHRFEGKLRSVFFVKATDGMPKDEEVETIQSDVIAPSYFASQDDSRWNHYLVFVVPSSAAESEPARRASIETNTSYARKLVVPDDEFGTFLSRRTGLEQNRTHDANALQVLWSTALSEAGLEFVDSDRPRTEIIQSIRTGTSVKTPKVAKTVIDTQPLTFLRSLEIRKFGTRTLSGEFNFGRVNLIRGVNGSGKTTLLEAIEHFLCGATARSQAKELLEATALFSNGQSAEYKTRLPSYYQQRDLKWYGRKFTRGNHLCEGFARYNYLNADAPVDFSRESDQQDLTAILSRVALGPDANTTWDRIQKVFGDIGPHLMAARKDVSSYEDRIKKAQERLSAISEPGPEISSRAAQVAEILSRLGWQSASAVLAEPSSFGRLATLKIAIDTLPPDLPPSLNDVENEVRQITISLGTIAEQQAVFRTIEGRIAELVAALKNVDSLARAVERLREYSHVGFAELMNSIAVVNRQPVEEFPSRELLTKLQDDLEHRLTLTQEQIEAPLLEVDTILRARIQLLQNSLDSTNAAIEKSNAKTEARQSLTGQLRGIGRELAKEHPLDGCPLCQTSMSSAELLRRIESSIAETGDEHIAGMEEERIRSSTILAGMNEVHGSLLSLVAFNPSLKLHSIAHALALADDAEERKAQINAERQRLIAQMGERETDGYSMPELMGLMSRCAGEISQDLNQLPHAESALEAAVNSVSVKRKKISDQLDDARNAHEANALTLTKLAISSSGASEPAAAKQILQARQSDLTRFSKAFAQLPASVRETSQSNLHQFSELAKIAYSQVMQISEDIGIASSRNSESAVLRNELATCQSEHTRLTKERASLQNANNVLSKILEEHSLEKGLSDFLVSNLASIQSIFERIHVPNELQLSNLNGCDLLRTTDGSVASLSQISTGQRAALVLSVFLTLNNSLRQGPPMMLVDDPVAHVDDMNSLALLDYLADVAEAGKRQIFFATADDKLANLFVKKMSFLGDEFRMVSLARKIAQQPSFH